MFRTIIEVGRIAMHGFVTGAAGKAGEICVQKSKDKFLEVYNEYQKLPVDEQLNDNVNTLGESDTAQVSELE